MQMEVGKEIPKKPSIKEKSIKEKSSPSNSSNITKKEISCSNVIFSPIKNDASLEEKIAHYNNQLKKISNFNYDINFVNEMLSNLLIIRNRIKLIKN